jgi:hypothetical protein
MAHVSSKNETSSGSAEVVKTAPDQHRCSTEVQERPGWSGRVCCQIDCRTDYTPTEGMPRHAPQASPTVASALTANVPLTLVASSSRHLVHSVRRTSVPVRHRELGSSPTRSRSPSTSAPPLTGPNAPAPPGTATPSPRDDRPSTYSGTLIIRPRRHERSQRPRRPQRDESWHDEAGCLSSIPPSGSPARTNPSTPDAASTFAAPAP